jgi:hypothetical protein
MDQHTEELIEQFWKTPERMTRDQVEQLKQHLLECESCMSLMASFECAKNIIDDAMKNLNNRVAISW